MVFIVPVKSKKLSSDWPHFSKLVERTLGSISHQTDKNFKAIVVCHELPDMNFSNDNLQFVQVDFDPPKLEKNNIELNNSLKEKDKALKIKVGIKEAKKYNPNFFMVVDSDDCISNEIVAYVSNQDVNKSGWYMKKGYFYREGQSFAYLNKETFNRFCGTSLILHASNMNKMFVENPLLSFNHKIQPESINLEVFPFAAALYSMGNGENHAMSKERIQGLLDKPKKSKLNMVKSLLNKIKKYRPHPLSNGFKKRFNFYIVKG